ncbi:MAG: yugJ, partial [Paenibacillus sp.]|nr:yugJ [Paenibacillus sp.]
MNSFQFHNPTRIVFGEGETRRIGELTATYGRNVLLVYGGGSIKTTGLYDQTLQSLKEADIIVHELSGIEPNP